MTTRDMATSAHWPLPDWKLFFLEHEVTLRSGPSMDAAAPENRYERDRPDVRRAITDIYFDGPAGELCRQRATLMLRLGYVDRPAILRLKLLLGRTRDIRHAVEMGSYVQPNACAVLSDASIYAVGKARELAGPVEFRPSFVVRQQRHGRYARLPDGHFVIVSHDTVSFRSLARGAWSPPIALVALQVQTYDPVCLVALEDLVDRYVRLGCVLEKSSKFDLARRATRRPVSQSPVGAIRDAG